VITFTSANSNAAQTVTVNAVNDNIANGNITATISTLVVSTDVAFGGITVPDISVFVIDNDVASIAMSKSLVSVVEGGAGDSYTFVLTSQPLATVTVTPSTNAQYTCSPTSLTFTSTNWFTTQVGLLFYMLHCPLFE
jgi:hypothetical protein